MHHYRIEFHSENQISRQDLSLTAPNVVTALIVADINVGKGSADLWDGERHIAHLQPGAAGRMGYWIVS